MSIILHFAVRSGIAVLSHHHPVLTDLITDGERRVFSPVPQTRQTLDLLTDTGYTAMQRFSAMLGLRLANIAVLLLLISLQ